MGVFLSRSPRRLLRDSLPHARGGVSFGRKIIAKLLQSSPRTWGCFSYHLVSWARASVFPTHVGVFLEPSLQYRRIGGLPHARGGVSHHRTTLHSDKRSSPRTWGCFLGVVHATLAHPVFPTHVGVFLSGGKTAKTGDDLAGELQRIYDAKTRIIRRQAKRKDGTAGKTYEQRNVLEAERFFSKDGSLSHVFEQALEAGFEFDNSGEMLSAIYDSLVYGRRTYATRGMSEGSMYSMSVGERSAPWKQEIITRVESTESGKKLVETVDRVKTGGSGYEPAHETVLLDPVNDRTLDAVMEKSGRDVSGYYHGISEDNIWHAYIGHSLDSILEDDQVSIEWDDFKILPDILSNWDVLEYQTKGEGEKLVYKKTYGDVEYTVVQRIGRKRRNHVGELRFVTEWISKKMAEGPGLSPGRRGLIRPSLRTGMTSQLRNEFKQIYKKSLKEGTFMKAPNGTDSNLSQFQWLAVRTQAFKNWFGDWEKVARFKSTTEKIMNMATVTFISGQEFQKDGIPLTEKVTKFWKERYNGIAVSPELGEVKLDIEGVKSSLPSDTELAH